MRSMCFASGGPVSFGPAKETGEENGPLKCSLRRSNTSSCCKASTARDRLGGLGRGRVAVGVRMMVRAVQPPSLHLRHRAPPPPPRIPFVPAPLPIPSTCPADARQPYGRPSDRCCELTHHHGRCSASSALLALPRSPTLSHALLEKDEQP